MKTPEQLKPMLLGAAGGAIALAILGFTWGGWVTAGNAAQTAEDDADSAVIAVLAPICVAQFRAQFDADQKLAEIKEMSSYKRTDFIEAGGWATMPGAEKPVRGVSDSCAKILVANA